MDIKKIPTILMVLCLVFSFDYSRAQAIDLQSANSFSVFAGVGAITNIGYTVIAGDLGYSTGSVLGFPPGIINGTTHYADSLSSIVNLDINAAYNNILSLTCDSTIGTTMGNSQTLTEGVYCMGAAATLVDTLFLDAQNDPSAVFVFKIGGAFATTAFSQVVLLNGASACNVYWSVTGAFGSGDSSVFKGTLIVDGELDLGLATDIEGRAFTISGAILMDSNTVFLPPSCMVVLPVTFLDFRGTFTSSNEVLLEWETAMEYNNSFYTVEKSTDCMNFESIATVEGKNISYTLSEYKFVESNVQERTLCYKLSQTDIDGSSIHLKTILVYTSEDIRKTHTTQIFPNPHHQNLHYIDQEITSYNSSVFTLSNAFGKKIRQFHLFEKQNLLETNLSPGIYYYTILRGDNTIESGVLLAE